MSRYYMILLALLLAVSTLFADVPRTISYQGRLTDSGVPISGIRGVSFKIYDGSGNPIWMSGIVNVNFNEGLFTVELGQSPQTPLPVDIWPSDTAITLGVTISPNPELTPRLHFKTVPFAIHALTAEWAASCDNAPALASALAKLHDWARLKDAVLPRMRDDDGAEAEMLRAYVALQEGAVMEGDARAARAAATSSGK